MMPLRVLSIAVASVWSLLVLPVYGQQPLYVSGRVMVDDGSPPPGRAAIQLRCSSAPITEGYANSEGYFNIELGTQRPDEFEDASTPAPQRGTFEQTNRTLSTQNLQHCAMLAQLRGYESEVVDLGRRRSLDNPDIGVILLHRLRQPDGQSVSATSAAAPKPAKQSYEKGLESARAGKLGNAQARFQKAVDLYPRYAAAWSDLGRIQAARGETNAARKSFTQAIAADDKFVPPYIELSALEYRERRWQPLADISEKAVKLDPFHYPQTFFLNAVANYNLRNLAQAEKSARRAAELDINHQLPGAFRLLAALSAERRDFTDAAAELRQFLALVPNGPDAEQARSQLQQLEQAVKTAPQQ